MISFILGYVVSNCCVQQKGRTCDAKYDSIETFHENVWMFVIRIIYPKKAQNILASFFDPDHQEGFYNVGRQSNTMVPETHQYIGYVRKHWWTSGKAVVQHWTSRLDGCIIDYLSPRITGWCSKKITWLISTGLWGSTSEIILGEDCSTMMWLYSSNNPGFFLWRFRTEARRETAWA